MKAVAILIMGLWLAVAPAKAQDADIRDVITRQIEAFLADDFATAFTFASPGIQSIFRNPERFGEMVRNGYPMVWRPADVKFGPIRNEGGRMVQLVYLTDQAGRLFEARYEMIRTEDGWEINGVAITEADLGA